MLIRFNPQGKGKAMSITIRQARPADAQTIYAMIYELAVYEKAPEEVVTTPEEIRETLFGAESKTEALICEVDGTAIGYAVFFTSYSTWLGRNGIYLEDLYISPDARGNGAGKALIKHIAQLAVQRRCGRLEWSVLDWNQPAIDFYLSIGAVAQSEWVRYRLDGDALLKFAEAGK
jgi:GNAT superfamily N-acetyltransferase